MKVLLLFLLVLFSFAINAKTIDFKKYFSENEINILSRSEEILSDYDKITFKIVQIQNDDIALVEYNTKHYILDGDLSGYVDGDEGTLLLKQGGPRSYVTILGARRTVESLIAISVEELDILKKALPLNRRKRLLEQELIRVAGEQAYKKNKELMKQYESITYQFLIDSKISNVNDVTLFRKSIVTKLNSFNNSSITHEYHGEDLTHDMLDDLRREIRVMNLAIQRELNDIKNRKTIAAMNETKRRAEVLSSANERQTKEDQSLALWKSNILLFMQITEELGYPSSRYVNKVNKAFKAKKNSLVNPEANNFMIQILAMRTSIRELAAQVKYKGKITELIDIPASCSPEKLEAVLSLINEKFPDSYLKFKEKIEKNS